MAIKVGLMFLAVAIFSPVATAQAETMNGRIVGIADGDTVTMLDSSKKQIRIRLAQIDAPETGHGKKKPGQPFGQKSKESLSDLVYGKEVMAECETKDRYGRQVCRLIAGGVDVNLEQIKRGMAWVYRKYARDAGYYQAEKDAQVRKKGLWADPNAIPPWEWRHR